MSPLLAHRSVATVAAVKRRSFPYPGHFICADRCRFFRHTHVGRRWCVSTVGDLHLTPSGPREPVGWQRDYETYVFDLRADPKERWQEVAADRAGSNATALVAHRRMYARIARKGRP